MSPARFHLLSAGAALCVGAGTLFPSLWLLAPTGLALLLLALLFAPNASWAAFAGFSAGFAAGAAGVWWMWDMLPLASPPGIAPLTQVVVVGSVWAMTALLAGIAGSIAALLLYALRHNVFFAPLAGIVWMMQEEARMWAYAAFSYAPDSLFGPHFSQTALGYAFAENGYLLQLARFGGIAALNFAVAALAATAVVLALAVAKRSFDARTGIALLLAAIVMLAPLAPRPEALPRPPLRVALISLAGEPDAPRVRALLEEAALARPDLVVLPESETFERFFPDSAERKEMLAALFAGANGLIMSAGYENMGAGLNSVLAYTSADGYRVGSYQKRFLMPQGEYYPLAALPLFSLSGDPKMSEYVRNAGHRLAPGSTPLAVPFGGHVIGGLICSELLSPHLYMELSEHYGASLLVNVANPSWFHGSRSYFDKTVQIAKVQAVTNGAPLIVADNGSPSFAVGAEGALIASAPWGVDDVLVLNIGGQ